ncbi:hypothetical protein [Hymenobacter arizonensis]|uniref:Uncharacterized protein n=1 Tax=Hymenobacter arizonensis TaxID=1227077 RepID=A0A1I5Z345_HYMAR|nr:hypothetical protein [Hymenobacter arizonensis]SFQ50889.1 hypothetical protein SAMN04515668_2663 [Hymenobacter arizonensis]
MKQISIVPFNNPGVLGLLRRRAVARVVAWALLLAVGPLLTGCQRFYRAEEKAVSRDTVSLLAESKTFVVHQGASVWELRSPRLNGEVLEGTKAPLSAAVSPFQQVPAKGKSPRYNKPDAPVVLNIVHVYIADAQSGAEDQVSIPFADIRQIDLIEKDSDKTTASYLLGGLGITVGAMAILLVIVALTKSSCPFVYAYDGKEYRFVGEAYGGAIFAPAERNDYLPLPALQPENNQYRLKISNELKERQYTNLAELWVVQHPATTQVLLDQRGRVQTLASLQPPTEVRSLAGHDYTAQLQATDHSAVLFNEDSPGSAPNEVVMTFAKPAGARQGKLVLHAQNSLWLDYLYGAFIEKFGAYYNTWAGQQRTQPAAINQQWSLDQGIPLKVYVETAQGWQLAETIPTIGPLASRDLVVPLAFAANDTHHLRVKLECGFMFWEVDYAALDCSPNAPVQLDNCRLISATTERGADAKAALAADDANYLQQFRPGTAVSLAYETKLPAPDAQTRRTTFLRTKGYYEHIRDFKGLPNLPELYAFKKPGRFIEFSKERYQEATQAMRPATASR